MPWYWPSASTCSSSWTRIGSAMQSITLAVPVRISTAGTRPRPSARSSSRWLTTPRRVADEGLAGLGLLGWREEVDEAGDGVGHAGGPHRRDHEVPDLGRGERGPGRLGVEQLAHEDHVGVLAQARAQRGGVAGRVAADLALGDDRLAVGVEDLDRVLDGEDVAAALAVDAVESAATVVVLPDPGGPVTSTRPRSSSAKRSTCGGRPSSSRSGISGGTRRTTMASEPRWRWMATRKRPRPATLNPELASPVVASSSWRAASRMLDGQRLHHARGRDLERGDLQLAVDADVGTAPGLRCRSEPRISCRYDRSSSSWVIRPTSAAGCAEHPVAGVASAGQPSSSARTRAARA